MPIIKIAIVDNHKIVVNGLETLLNVKSEIKVILKALNGKQLLELLKESAELPDIIILDVEMPEMNGEQTLIILNELYPSIKVIMLSFHSERLLKDTYISKGACAYLCKDGDHTELEECIRKVFNSSKPVLQNQNTESQHLEKMNSENVKILFSKCELKILNLISQLNTNKEISSKLSISPRTVEFHRLNIYKKTNSKSLNDLLSYIKNNNIYIP